MSSLTGANTFKVQIKSLWFAQTTKLFVISASPRSFASAGTCHADPVGVVSFSLLQTGLIASPPAWSVALCFLAPPLPDILLAVPGTLLHEVLLAQRYSPDSVALHSKLTSEHPKERICSKGEHILPK
ncbi:hypothetical protein DSO57_1021931 [Entomophthora muscae]|uniref:Uncharacterized protein n=1 Tax=Entomophthora muscae TaxID=34485 RepID=A0ACC2UP73_9FUNG|nr:hypothetical protein DSO57_1021931 [Entomophthora muscae]